MNGTALADAARASTGGSDSGITGAMACGRPPTVFERTHPHGRLGSVVRVYRFLLSGRWIALLMVGLILVAAFTLLGFWQLGKFRTPAPVRIESSISAVPAEEPAPGQLTRRPPGAAQNLGYALQWWVFAGATVFFGIRALRIEAQDRVTPPGGPPVTPAAESDAAHP